jgi:hypothetical protein
MVMSYVVQYRVDGSWRMSLKDGLTLMEARRGAKAILGAVAKGGNPLRSAPIGSMKIKHDGSELSSAGTAPQYGFPAATRMTELCD